MALKTILNYSPNFNPKKRTSKQIKFIIFHYTGMKKESEAINRLTNIQSEVSCHYLIKNNGEYIHFSARFIYSLACRKIFMEKL